MRFWNGFKNAIKSFANHNKENILLCIYKMFFTLVYIADRIATISFNVGSWIISNGTYYIYSKVRGDYVSISREEYNRLLQNQK